MAGLRLPPGFMAEVTFKGFALHGVSPGGFSIAAFQGFLMMLLHFPMSGTLHAAGASQNTAHFPQRFLIKYKEAVHFSVRRGKMSGLGVCSLAMAPVAETLPFAAIFIKEIN